MRNQSASFICSAALWIILFAAVAVVAKNFGSISGTDDLFSYNFDTGRLCILGERFDVPKTAVDNAVQAVTSLGEFHLAFTPLTLFDNK